MARLILACCAVVLAMDAFDVVVSMMTGIPYNSFGYFSDVVYFAIGFFAFRVARSMRSATLVALAAAFTESTLGWYLSALMGPGKPKNGDPSYIAAGVLYGTVFQTVVAIIGALAARVILRARLDR